MGLLIMKYFSVIGDDFIIRIWPHNMSRAGRRSCHSLAAEHGTGGRFRWQSAARKQFDEANRQISEKNARSERIEDFIGKLKEQNGVIEEFDPWLWACMVDFVTVGRRKEMIFTFRDGTEIEV